MPLISKCISKIILVTYYLGYYQNGNYKITATVFQKNERLKKNTVENLPKRMEIKQMYTTVVFFSSLILLD